MLAARLHRRRLGLRCSRCLRHLMLAVHSTQRTPRLLPDRVVATTASAGCVRPQVPEPCWQRSRPQHISPYTHTQRRGAAPAAATFAELRITYANTAPVVLGYLTRGYARSQPKKHSRPYAQRGCARGWDATPVSVICLWCVFIPVTICNAAGHLHGHSSRKSEM